jgi:hypothetical protein
VTQPTQSTAAAPAKEATAAPIKPGGPGDTWVQAVGDDGSGHPLIHSLRNHALELPGRDRFRWRIGVTWRFPHALANGMPGPQDRLPMNAVDDAIHEIFEHDDANRIVYFTTGGGMREVMLYGSDEAAAWERFEALRKRFPDLFPGNRTQWAYVQPDPEWHGYDAAVNAMRAAQ